MSPEIAEVSKEEKDFLGSVLRPEDPTRLFAEYPLVYRGKTKGGVSCERLEGQPVSGAAYLPIDLRTQPEVSLRIGGIGSVVTHPDFRRRGLAGKVLTRCEAALLERHCSLALLWSQAPGLYERSGYSEAGWETNFVLPMGEVMEASGPGGYVTELNPETDAEACLQLYRQNSVGVERTLEEFRQLLEIPDMSARVHRHMAKVTAYALIGKGNDYRGAIHEWGGKPEGVLAIARDTFKRNLEPNLALISTPARPDMQEALNALKIEPVHGVLGMFKVLDRGMLGAAVKPMLAEKYNLDLQWNEEGYAVHRDGESMAWSEKEFLRFLFGYKGPSGEGLAAANRFDLPELREQVPVQVFLWGLDSV